MIDIHLLGRNSIRRKLALIAMVTSTVAFVIPVVLVAAHNSVRSEHALTDKIAMMADLTGARSRAALLRADTVAGSDLQSDLGLEPRVTRAAIYTTAGQRFASYAMTVVHRCHAPAQLMLPTPMQVP